MEQRESPILTIDAELAQRLERYLDEAHTAQEVAQRAIQRVACELGLPGCHETHEDTTNDSHV